MTSAQKLQLMTNSPALLEAVALLLPLARKEAQVLAESAKFAIGYSATSQTAQRWLEAVLVAERAIIAAAPHTLPQTFIE
jgi:hypothetical protein